MQAYRIELHSQIITLVYYLLFLFALCGRIKIICGFSILLFFLRHTFQYIWCRKRYRIARSVGAFFVFLRTSLHSELRDRLYYSTLVFHLLLVLMFCTCSLDCSHSLTLYLFCNTFLNNSHPGNHLWYILGENTIPYNTYPKFGNFN